MQVTEYSFQAPLRCRIALLADIHERNVDEVLPLLEALQPDLICLAGDTLERTTKTSRAKYAGSMPLRRRLLYLTLWGINDALSLIGIRTKEPDPKYIFPFLERLSRIPGASLPAVPVVMSLGNHEAAVTEEDSRRIRACGIHLLNNDDCTIPIGAHEIRIGGLSTEADEAWLESFCQKPGYKLLLCHHPDFYESYLLDKNLDLILSGHVHGGQIRLCGRGLFAPGQGLFPKYARGVYHGKLVVSAGCSNTAAIPRWGNPTELVMLQLEPNP